MLQITDINYNIYQSDTRHTNLVCKLCNIENIYIFSTID